MNLNRRNYETFSSFYFAICPNYKVMSYKMSNTNLIQDVISNHVYIVSYCLNSSL